MSGKRNPATLLCTPLPGRGQKRLERSPCPHVGQLWKPRERDGHVYCAGCNICIRCGHRFRALDPRP